MLEASAALHEVRDTLGHTNMTMTSTYLWTTKESLKPSSKKLEAHRCRRNLRVVAH